MIRAEVVAIVPAAGCGKRLGLKEKKPLVRLGRRPLITYALEGLNKSSEVGGIIIASQKSCIGKIKKIVKKYGFHKVIDVIEGGRTRQESVRNCIDAIKSEPDIVLIHDAARPFLDGSVITRSIKAAMKHGGAIAAVPEKDTVKTVDRFNFITGTLDRSRIFRAQTPQAFRFDILKKAYRAGHDLRQFTDDASIVESMGFKVKIIEGTCKNLKITTREDLKFAEVLL